MKKLILLFGLLPIISLAATDVILKEYGVATSVNLCLYDYNTPVDEVDSTTFTFAAGDVTVMLDDGTPANINGLPTDEGTCLSVALTAGEVTSAKTLVRIVDQTAPAVWMDESFTIETYGNASAMHPDIDIAAAQSDLDLLTGTDGATLATTQGNYAPAKAGDSMDLVTDAIDDGSINAAQTELASATDLAAAQGDLDTLTAGVTVTAVSVAGLADFFDTDSGTTYGAAIGGSVVKEIADNAGGSALTVEDIRAEMDSNSTQLAAIVADTNALRRTIAVFDTTIAAYTANDDFTITAGPADDDAIKGCMAMVTDQGDPTQIAYFGIAGYTASSKTIAGDEDPAVFTYANGDSVTISCFGVTTEFMNRSEVIGAGNAGDLWRGN